MLAALPANADEITEIDLLVLHTPAVTSNYRGTSGVAAHAMASVASVNDAMENSEIPVFFNLVAVEEVVFTESDESMFDDLDAISARTDPIEAIHFEVLELRNKYGADLVTLFRDGPAGGAAGLAFLPDPANDAEDQGYSVVSAQSALNNLVLAHELGHNMSAAHARGESGSPPPIDEAHGYRFSAGGSDYRTIMSITSSHTRIDHFSNPAVLFQGVATGLPVRDPESADNASAFAVSAPVIAGFRRTQTDTPTFLEEPVGDTLVAGGDSRLRALLRGLPPLTVEWFEGEVGDDTQALASTETELERGGTESVVELGAISETISYWLRVTNPNDTLESRSFQVVLVPAPSGADTLVEQAERDNASSISFNVEQDMTVPVPAYLGAIEVYLAKVGDPPNPTVSFEQIDGPVIAEQEIDASQLDTFTTGPLTAVELPLGLFVAPGSEYRVTVTPGDGQDGSNLIVWGFALVENVTDPNVGSASVSLQGGGDVAFMFSLTGTEAWTYHTWLRQVQPPEPATGRHPDDKTGGLPNLIRYALGGDFTTPAAALQPELRPLESGSGGTEAPIRFTRRPGVVDVEFIVEQSDDLENWTAVDSGQIEALAPTPEGNEAYEARVPYSGDRLFLRLNTANPPTP